MSRPPDGSSMREAALAIYKEALATLDPRRLTRAAAPALTKELWAVGKAAEAMAQGVRDVSPVERELIVSPKNAGHPVPDERSLAAGKELLARAAALPYGATAVLALSGGASALAVAPAWGLSLEDKIAATRAVAASGAPIAELNCVRKHLSALKGGRLAAATGARIVALILSDVVGDDLAVIGSGPASPDPTTFADALAIAVRADGVPASAIAALEAGARGELPETPKQLSHVATTLLCGPGDLAAAAGRAAGERGLAVTVEPLVEGSVETLAERIAARAAEQGPGRASVWVGEPVIRLPPSPGRGGRAQHTALLVARALARRAPEERALAVLCAASDGRDGPTEDAGGILDAAAVEWARAHRDEVEHAVARCDAGPTLAAAGALLTVGMTGTNLTDLYVVLT